MAANCVYIFVEMKILFYFFLWFPFFFFFFEMMKYEDEFISHFFLEFFFKRRKYKLLTTANVKNIKILMTILSWRENMKYKKKNK